MITDIINVTLNGLTALLIFGALTLAYTILSAYANINIYEINKSFDRKKWLNGLAKYGLLAVAVLITLIGSYAAVSLSASWGIELLNAQQIGDKVIYAVLLAGIAAMAAKNIAEIANIVNVKKELLDKIKQTAVDTPADAPLILDVADLPDQVAAQDTEVEKTLIEKTVEEYLEEVGGRGAAVARVSVASPDAFRNAVIGRAYDVDGYYWAQCWDGLALFWLNAVGRTFSTGGTGAIKGGWEVAAARKANQGSQFDLITDKNKIKKGDFVIFGGTQYGHGGMAMSGNLGNYVKLLGQNQTGTGSGAPFNEINMSLNNFIGAFRYKKWHASAPAPKPAPKPSTSGSTSSATYKIVKAINGYYTSADAKNKKNARVKVAKGSYYVFNKSNGMVNVTTKKGVAGSWINPTENKTAAAKPAAKKYVTVKKGWGLSNVAQAAGFKDFGSATRWAAIAKLNGSSNWNTYNRNLKPNQKVRVQ